MAKAADRLNAIPLRRRVVAEGIIAKMIIVNAAQNPEFEPDRRVQQLQTVVFHRRRDVVGIRRHLHRRAEVPFGAEIRADVTRREEPENVTAITAVLRGTVPAILVTGVVVSRSNRRARTERHLGHRQAVCRK